MADDFKINVITTYDGTGVRRAGEDLDKIKRRQAEAEAKWERSPLNPKNRPPTPPTAGGTTEAVGSAIGLATIVTLVTGAIAKWKQFNDEQDRFVEKMIDATAKMRDQALSVAEIKDLDFSQELIDQSKSIEELTANVDRLKNKIAVLKAAQDALDPLTQANEWKALRSEIKAYEGQLNSATSAIERQTAATKKDTEEKERNAAAAVKSQEEFLGGAVGTAPPQVQAALRNEEAARKAREAGLDKDADLYQKSADQIKKSFSGDEAEQYRQLTEPLHARTASPGESQEAIDQMARNKINFDRQLRGEPPLPPGPGLGPNPALQQAIEQAFGRVMDKYWGR